MQYDSEPQNTTIDPKLLNRKEYPSIPTYTSNITTALKTSGNGVFNLEGRNIGAQNIDLDAGSGHDQHRVEVPDLGSIEDIGRRWDTNTEFSCGHVMLTRGHSLNQARSAPSQAWGYDPRQTFRPRTEWTNRDNEPWSHLPTCDISVPIPNHRSSWNSQNGAINELPSNGTDSIGSTPLLSASYRRYQTDDKHASHMHPSSFGTQSTGYHDQPITPLYPNPSTHPAQLPIPNDSKSLMINSPRLRPPLIHGDEISEEAIHSEFDWDAAAHDGIDVDDMMCGVVGESGQMLQPDFSDILTSSGYSGQNHQTFSYTGRQFNSAETDFDFDPQTQNSVGVVQHGHAENIHSPFVHLKDWSSHPSETLDHPNAIRIPGSSNRFQPDLPSSYPPSAHCFPPFHLHQSPSPHSFTSPRHRPRGATVSTSQPTVFPSKQSNLAIRRKPRNAASPRKSRSNSLSIIQENGQPTIAMSPPGSKGRRTGALPQATAAAAAHTRAEKSACIRCRVLKIACKRDGSEMSCDRCQKNYSARSWDQPCVRAHFLDLIEAETCNPIFQESCSHITLDGSQRLTLKYSSKIDIGRLLETLGSCQSRYNIEVVHYSGTTYTLDLSKISSLLCKIHDPLKERFYQLGDFLENKGVPLSDWVDCIESSVATPGVLDRFTTFNDTPSHNGYRIVPLNVKAPPLPLNVEDSQHKQAIILAAQLCRIILRALEISAFKALQKEVNDLNKSSKPHTEIRVLERQLLQILSSLRGRLNWWQQFGYGSTGYVNANTDLVGKVTKLAQVLYFWYFVARSRLSSSRSATADADPVDDGSPTVESLAGFTAWMHRDPQLIQEALDQQRLPSYG